MIIRPFENKIPEKSDFNQDVSRIVVQSSRGNVLGYQYALLIFPLARIKSDSLLPDIELAFKEAALLQQATDFRSYWASSYQSKNKLAIKKFNLNVYDYIFYRKTACSISANLVSEINSQKVNFKFNTDYSWWSAFGFRKEIEYVYAKCLRKFASEVTLKAYE